MKTILHKAEDRGRADYGWLKAYYSFSFANWYEPTRMGFGALRVINDDVVAPRSGFPTHEHDNMEIITIVTRGAVTHTDSMGNSGKVPAGEVQVMSAGTGVRHSEMNNENEPLELFQIWIMPKKQNITPRYDQKEFILEKNKLTKIVSGEKGEESLWINQRADLYLGEFEKGETLDYRLGEGRGAYVFVISGEVGISGEKLSTSDAIGISDTESFSFSVLKEGKIFIINVPIAVGH